jgi:hypothetical protein
MIRLKELNGLQVFSIRNKKTNYSGAEERRFSGCDQAKNVFGFLSARICIPLNTKDLNNFLSKNKGDLRNFSSS